MGRAGLQHELHLDRPDGRLPLQHHDPVLPGRERVPGRADRVCARDPALARVRDVRGRHAAVGRRLRLRVADAAPRARHDVVVQQHRVVVHLRRRPVGVLRPLRPRAVPAHRWRHVGLEHDDPLGQHAGREDRHADRRHDPDRRPVRGLLAQPAPVFPAAKRALPRRHGEHRALDRRVRGEGPRRRRGRDQLDLRLGQRVGRAQGGLAAGIARSAQHDPADDLALPRARLQPVVGLHRRRGAAGIAGAAVVDAGRRRARTGHAHAAHLGGAALDRVHALERARQRLRLEPGAVLDARLQRDRRRRQRQHDRRHPDPGRVRLLELHLAARPDPERLPQPGRIRHRRRHAAPVGVRQRDHARAARGDLARGRRLDRVPVPLRLHAHLRDADRDLRIHPRLLPRLDRRHRLPLPAARRVRELTGALAGGRESRS